MQVHMPLKQLRPSYTSNYKSKMAVVGQMNRCQVESDRYESGRCWDKKPYLVDSTVVCKTSATLVRHRPLSRNHRLPPKCRPVPFKNYQRNTVVRSIFGGHDVILLHTFIWFGILIGCVCTNSICESTSTSSSLVSRWRPFNSSEWGDPTSVSSSFSSPWLPVIFRWPSWWSSQISKFRCSFLWAICVDFCAFGRSFGTENISRFLTITFLCEF